MLLRIAIVEDEKKAQDTLKGYLERFGKENEITFLIDVYGTPVMLLDQYKAEYNIIFLDIQMPDINGMDAAKRIRAMDSSVILIFVTSLTQYAIAGYEVEALDYIVKPVQYYNFALKMTKALRHVGGGQEDAISVSTEIGTARINLRDIRYIEVQDHLLTYYTFDGTYSEFQTISSVEKRLKDKGFVRPSNACLVNLRCIKGYKGYTLFLNDGTELRISQPRKRALVKAIEEQNKTTA
jgi:DNA-binding LytR/AlgR family response regulator